MDFGWLFGISEPSTVSSWKVFYNRNIWRFGKQVHLIMDIHEYSMMKFHDSEYDHLEYWLGSIPPPDVIFKRIC